MKKLINGIVNFRSNNINNYRSKFAQLALNQKPDAMMIACCDSRVVPNVFASSDPGDLFVVRNVGNLVPTYNQANLDRSTASAIEFSVLNLKVKDIIICGHSECGAMCELMTNNINHTPSTPMLEKWLELADTSYVRFKNETGETKNHNNHNALSQINVLEQLDNLRTYPWLQEKINNKQLRIHGWWFDLATADVYYYNHSQQKFILLDESEAKKLLQELSD